MYAEERQQAMAQLIGQQGRLSVAQLADDLSRHHRDRAPRPLRPGADRPGPPRARRRGAGQLAHRHRVRASASATRPTPPPRTRSPPPPSPCCPRPARSSSSTPGSTTARLAARPPPRPPAHRRHPRGAGGRAARRPAPHRAAPAARARSARPPTPPSAPTRSPRSRDVRVDVAFVATNGSAIGYGLTTPDRDEAATKRAIVGCRTAYGRARRLHQDRRRDLACGSPRSPTSTSWSPTADIDRTTTP